MPPKDNISKTNPLYWGMKSSSKADRKGVTLAEFNKNPGNIMYYQVHTSGSKKGQIIMKDGKPRITSYAQGLIDDGYDIQPGAANWHGVLIHFASDEDGLKAKKEWWQRTKNWRAYKGKTVDEALMTYSGNGYDSSYLNVGIKGTRLLSDLNQNELDSLSINQIRAEDVNNYKRLIKNNLITVDPNTKIASITTQTAGKEEELLQKEYEKYANELGGEGGDDANILSYEDYYKEISSIGSPRAKKLKRDSLQGLGPRIVKTEEKKEEAGVVGKVDEEGKLDLTPSLVLPGTTIGSDGAAVFPSQEPNIVDIPTIEEYEKDKAIKKEEEDSKVEKDKKEIEKVGQTEEEVIENEDPNLLETIDDDEKEVVEEEEVKEVVEEKPEFPGLLPEVEVKGEKVDKEVVDEEVVDKEVVDEEVVGEEVVGEEVVSKDETVMVDEDVDGIPDTIDADGGMPAPEGQETVSVEEKKEDVVETTSVEVLDAEGNERKITVPVATGVDTSTQNESIDTQPGKKIEIQAEQPDVTGEMIDSIDEKSADDIKVAEIKAPVNNTEQEVVEKVVEKNPVLNAVANESTSNTNPVNWLKDSGFIGTDESQSDTALVKTINNVFNELLGDTSTTSKLPLTSGDKAWCGALVYEVLTSTNAIPDLKTSGDKKASETAYNFLRAREYLKVGTNTTEPKIGDIMVTSRPGGFYHVGFYAGTDANGNVLQLGGNQNNKLSYRTVPKGQKVVGYRRLENMADVKEAAVVSEKTMAKPVVEEKEIEVVDNRGNKKKIVIPAMGVADANSAQYKMINFDDNVEVGQDAGEFTLDAGVEKEGVKLNLDIENITPQMGLDRGGFAPVITSEKPFKGKSDDELAVMLDDAITKGDDELVKDLVDAGALTTEELVKQKKDAKAELDKTAKRHTAGNDHFDKIEYIDNIEKKYEHNTAETLKSRYPDVDLKNIVSKEDWLAAAVKSKDQGGLGLTGTEAETEWENTYVQFDDRGEIDYSRIGGSYTVNYLSRTVPFLVGFSPISNFVSEGDPRAEVALGEKVYETVMTDSKGETRSPKFDNEEQEIMFKKQLLNAVPREDWVEWVNFSGKSDWNNLRESYILKATAAVFNDEMDISSKKGAALETRSIAFDSKKQNLVNNVANWENETSNLKKQIHDIKAKYGHFRGGKYTQLVDFSLADKQALRQLLKEGDDLEYQRLGLTISQKDLVYEREQFNTDATKWQEDRDESFANWGWNVQDGVFDPAFNSTKAKMEWNESIKNTLGWSADVFFGNFVEEMLRYRGLRAAITRKSIKAFGRYVLPVTIAADVTSSLWQDQVYQFAPNRISEYNDGGMHHTGMVFDALASAATVDFIPTSNDSSGKILDPKFKKQDGDGWWGNLYEKMAPGWAGGQGNWNAYSTSKTFAKLLPYTLNIMSAYRGTAAQSAKYGGTKSLFDGRSKVAKNLGVNRGFGKKIVNSLNREWLTSPRMMGSYNMMRINHKMTFFDNYADGRARGLDAAGAFTYGNFLSLATGVSQTIMPDYNWINTSGGKKIVNRLVGDLMEGSYVAAGKTVADVGRAATNRAALQVAGKNFLKEHIEEQTDVLLQDVVKSATFAEHSPDILKVEMQAEVLSGTTVLTLPLGSISAVRTRNDARAKIYRMFEQSGQEIINNGRAELRVIDKKIAETDNTSKGIELRKVLNNEKQILESNIKEGENIVEALKASPKNVTDTQVDLLVQKSKLNKRKKELSNKDKAFSFKEIEEINDAIASIDEEIKVHDIGNYQNKLYNKLLENAIKLAPKLGFEIVEKGLNEEEYGIAVEIQRKKRQVRNAYLKDQIALIKENKPKTKKAKKEQAAQIRRLERQMTKENVSLEGPGHIDYDFSGNNNHRIFIRPGAAKWSGNNAVVLHEMLHVMLFNTLFTKDGRAKNAKSLKALSYLLREELLNNPEKYQDTRSYVASKDNVSGKFDQYKFDADHDGNFSVQFDEMFTVFIEALAQGNISVKSNIITEINDVFRRMFRKAGVNFKVKGHQGMVNFLRDFNDEMMQGDGNLSKGMVKIFEEGMQFDIDPNAKTAADKYERLMMEMYGLDQWKPAETKYSKSIVAKNSSQNVYKNKMIKDDLKITENTKRIVEENSRIRELILEEGIKGKGGKIVASEDLQTKLVENNMGLAVNLGMFAAQNPNIMGLEAGKRITADQFISGYYLQLNTLAGTYDASVNEFGQYLNTILPLRYGEILAAEKAGAVEGSVGLDLVKDLEDDVDEDYTPDDIGVGALVDTAKRLGVKNETKPFIDELLEKVKKLDELRTKISNKFDETTASEIAALESEGVADIELDAITVKKAPNLLYKFTSKLFGIDEGKLNPKSEKWLANLRKDNKRGTNEVRAAQRAVVQNVQLILSTIFNEGHTKAHKSSGMPRTLLKFGYNKSSKRIGNSFPQYKKPNLSEKDFLEYVGVYKVKGGFEFKVDRNTGTKLIAIASMVDRNMSLQAINENLVQTGDITSKIRVAIEDGMSKSSKSIYYIKNPELQPIINEKLHVISDRFDNADVRDIKALKKIVKDVFKGTEVNGTKFADSLLGKTGVITRYVEMPYVKADMSFEEFASKEIEYETLRTGVFSMLGLKVDKKADLYTNSNMKLARSRVAEFVTTVLEGYQNKNITKKKAMQLLYMLEQQHITAAKAGNGRTWFVDGTNQTERAVYPPTKTVKGKKVPHPKAGQYVNNEGKQRDQLFGSKQGSAMDFRLFINKTLSGTGLEFGLTTTENNKIKKDLGITSLTQQKSKSVIEDLIKKAFNFKARKDEAMMARELVKMQIKFYAEHNMMSNEELAMHIFTFGSNMSTASRRAANVHGIQQGILSGDTSGKYIYGEIKNAGKTLEYEHGKPHEQLMLELLGTALKYKGKGKAMDDAMNDSFVDYEVNIITKKMDATLTASNRKSRMGSNYIKGLLQGWRQRLYNEENFGHPDVGAIISLDGENTITGEGHSKALKVLPKSKADVDVDIKVNKGLKGANSINYNKNIKGITVLDFDDTLATSKSMIRYTKPDGTKGKLNAEQYASTYEELSDLGYQWDFSEFSKVVDGKTAPLFNKALKLQSKFGPENMFVLTARPAESAEAIFEFLQANGLKIPLKNITGLANSTSEAKALWMAEKVGEGYNDFYFADDALQNVQAVQNILDQFDVKSKVQQARSKSINYNKRFNDILEETTGEKSEKVFSKAKARKRGEEKGKYKIFIPPSAEDFVGLLYSFLSKGKIGEQQFEFFKEALIEPLNRAYRMLDSAKQAISNDYKQLGKAFPGVRKKLFEKINKDYTYNDAIRVYLWNKFNFKIWGLSETDEKTLVALVEGDENLKAYADALSIISKAKDGYVEPSENWAVEDIRTDLMNAVNGIGRKSFFAEFLENAEMVFSEENLNKIEAIYGSNFREALQDMLYRIENGTNRSFGSNRLVNRFMNWINGSIGTTMFFNSRSAVLQTLSTVNFINWSDNNVLAAAKAFANQKQFWADFSMIFNSDMLKQRREGRSFDINANEIASMVSNEKTMAGKMKASLNYLLKIGFLPTQLADSFAIAAGGSTFYRNRLSTYLVEGMGETEAKAKAFADFQVIAEATQQSARQDMVSQQQASVLGRIILAFQNTPMQYARLMKKAILDLQAGRGDAKSNVSKIVYYGAVQNVIFYSLQTALFAAMFGEDDDDEEFIDKKTERVISGSIDSILRGMGVGGAIVSTVKNMIKTYAEQSGKPSNRKDDTAVLMEMLNISPPIGIKARQMKSSSRNLNWNKKTISQMPYYNLDNPIWESVGLTTQAVTNVPLARLHTKVTNIRESVNKENEGWQRLAMLMGWSKWNLGIKDKSSKKAKSKTRSRSRTRSRTRSRVR